MYTIIIVNSATQRAFVVGKYRDQEHAMGDYDHITNVIGNDPQRTMGIVEILSVEEYLEADHRTIEEEIMSWL